MEKKLDLRIEKTYLMLHNAFTELLEQRRFEDFTVNELCQRAMIRRTTFYKHFADKYEYFTFYIREVGQSFQDQLPPDALSDNLDAYFLLMCRELLRFVTTHEAMVKHVMESNVSSILFDSLSEFIAFDVLQVLRKMPMLSGTSSDQLEGIAAFYSGGMLSTLRFLLRQGRPIDEEQFIGIIAAFLREKSVQADVPGKQSCSIRTLDG